MSLTSIFRALHSQNRRKHSQFAHIITIQNSSDMRGKEDSRPAVLKSVLRMNDSPRFSRNPLGCLFQKGDQRLTSRR